jgi:Rrf2 family nitric oxide-sensitive transcriptional repressor
VKLTQFTDYGLRALMVLASNPDIPFNSRVLSDVLDISREHLVKILKRLSDGGYVRSQRGVGGGVRLAIDANSIPIGHLIRWLEDGQGLVECMRPEKGGCNLTPLCLLRPMLEAGAAAFYAQLNAYTLADCIHPPLTRFAAAAYHALLGVNSSGHSGAAADEPTDLDADELPAGH